MMYTVCTAAEISELASRKVFEFGFSDFVPSGGLDLEELALLEFASAVEVAE